MALERVRSIRKSNNETRETMIYTLTRTERASDGIWGELLGPNYASQPQKLYTLEHPYLIDNHFTPKVPEGTYTCVRSMHQLVHMSHPFQTFQITNVPEHNNILFHMGSFASDSKGCVLVGEKIKGLQGGRILFRSLLGFNSFMHCLNGIDRFTLIVQNKYL